MWLRTEQVYVFQRSAYAGKTRLEACKGSCIAWNSGRRLGCVDRDLVSPCSMGASVRLGRTSGACAGALNEGIESYLTSWEHVRRVVPLSSS
jgi:hypothetical protein